MNKSFLIRIVFVCLAVLSPLLSRADAVKSCYTLDVHDFTTLKVDNSISVDYVCNPDSAGMATFDTTDDLASLLIFSNNSKGVLSIELNTDGYKYHGLPTIRVYSSFLNKIENSGDSLVRVLSVAPCPEFSATLIGNGRLSVHDVRATTVNGVIRTGRGTLVINGECTKANFRNTGTGSIQADGLKSRTAVCKLIGTGPVGCSVADELTIQGMGSSKVYYRALNGTDNLLLKNRAVGVKAIDIDSDVVE